MEPARPDAPLKVHARIPPIPEAEERNLAEHLHTLLQARFLISAVVVASVAAGLVYLSLATPIYRSDVVLQVEDSGKSIAGLSELSALLGEKALAETEMEILRSRSLVGAVVEQLSLDIEASPVRFPVLGALARRYRGTTPAPPLLDLTSYAWGGERIAVRRLDVPEDLLNAKLTLEATGGRGYALRGPDDRPILTGEIGKAATGGHANDQVQIFVSDLIARPGTLFTVSKRSRNQVVEQLQQELRISEKGKKTGVLVVALPGPNPQRLASILDTLATNYVRQNVERKSAEAARTLEFLESQLPTLRANLDAAETAFRGYQVQKGMVVDLTAEAQSMLERSVGIERSLSEAELQRSDLKQRFTESHPALLALTDKIEKLRAERGALNTKMRTLPGTELEAARLSRDVKVAGELYNILLNKAQELRVVKSGTIGNVRIVDRATLPDRPTSPKSSMVLIVSVMLGLCGGIAIAFARKSLYTGVDDPEMMEQLTGVPVYATVPRSARQAALGRKRRRAGQGLLAAVDPMDQAVEALRSLRTGLQFSLLEAPNNVIVITGPTADVGKSFVAVNLAHVMASAGRRVLVIDGDLRRGRLHKSFGGNRSPGLCDVLNGNALLAEVIHKSPLENLHWLPTGHLPPNPTELVGSDRFRRVLGDLSSRYDLVVVDTAPILPVTDAALIAQSAGTTLLVLRAGMHSGREILSAVKRLSHNGVKVQGAVFNDVSGAGARYSRYGYQYRYDSRT